MGYRTVRFEEFDQRAQQYWFPEDFDLATVSAEIAYIAQGWNGQGYLRLVFDDATQVLTEVDHVLPTGNYQEVWATGESPAEAAAAAQRAYRKANGPQTFAEMWQTYNGWDEYLQFAQSHYMTESTNFLLAVEAYRQAPGLAAQLELYARFIAPEAPEQVNIDGAVVRAIEARTDGGADVFDGAQRAVMDTLAYEFDKFLAWYRGLPVT
jgi:hypothetical protein